MAAGIQGSAALFDFGGHLEMCREALQTVMMANSVEMPASQYCRVRLAKQTEEITTWSAHYAVHVIRKTGNARLKV
jgi:hypothetical protein